MNTYVIIVRPAPDEPTRVTRGQVLDALRWLVTRRDAGVIESKAWSTKGGWVRLQTDSMEDCARPLVEVIAQLIPFDERPTLERLGIATRGPLISDGYYSLKVTEFGFRVIDACPDLVMPEENR